MHFNVLGISELSTTFLIVLYYFKIVAYFSHIHYSTSLQDLTVSDVNVSFALQIRSLAMLLLLITEN